MEKGYMLDFSSKVVDQFIIHDAEMRNIGTIEFKPYGSSTHNTINTIFPFYKIDSIAAQPEKVLEIDKVSILKQHRGKNLERLLSVFVSYTEFHKIEYGVALLERVFFKALKNVYKIPLEAVGEQIYYKGDYVIPTIIYPNMIYSEKGNFKWLNCEKPNFSKSPHYVLSNGGAR